MNKLLLFILFALLAFSYSQVISSTEEGEFPESPEEGGNNEESGNEEGPIEEGGLGESEGGGSESEGSSEGWWANNGELDLLLTAADFVI